MPTPALQAISTVSASGFRYIPMDWAPRWVEAYYNQNDLLRNLIFSWVKYPLSQASFLAKHYTRESFYGHEGAPRSAYVLNWNYTDSFTPKITLTNTTIDQPTNIVYWADTYNSFLAEPIYPVCFKSENGPLYFRNLEVVYKTVTSASGILDLTTAFSEYPKSEDEPIILENAWKDIQIVDPADRRWLSSTTLQVLATETFTVYWNSTRIRSAVLSGSSQLLVADETYTPATLNLYNNWDALAGNYGLWRKDLETNTSLKARFQRVALSHNTTEHLSSVFGQTQIVLWDTRKTWSLSGSGAHSVHVVNQSQYRYIQEKPIKNSAELLLTHSPSGGVYLFYKSQLVTSDEWSIEGNVLNLLTPRLILSGEEDFRVHYRIVNFQLTKIDEVYTSLDPGSLSPDLKYVLIAQKVQLLNNPKRQRSWRWDRPNNKVSGSAIFN